MRSILLALLLLAMALAGCSGEAPGPTYVTPEMDDDGHYVIKMTAANRFIPQHAEVPVGATVVWVNEGGSHNVRFHDAAIPSSAVSPERGEHHRVTFDTPGTYEYECTPHVAMNMKGTIRVVA